MPVKRSHSPNTDWNDTSDSGSDGGSSSRRIRPSSPWSMSDRTDVQPLRVYILPIKLDTGTFENLITLVEENTARISSVKGGMDKVNLQLSGDLRQADVIVTAVHMRRRLERHVDWELAVRLSFPLRSLTGRLSSGFVRKQRPSLHQSGSRIPFVRAPCYHAEAMQHYATFMTRPHNNVPTRRKTIRVAPKFRGALRHGQERNSLKVRYVLRLLWTPTSQHWHMHRGTVASELHP